jgi:DNA-binding response OmpR family regulator
MKQMLIVEDERDICECLREFFTDRGFSVISVFSGEEAIARLGETSPDVILLDILLPGVSGIEVLKQAKQLHPSARVVMVTALDREDLRLQARSYGACGYVTKPFDFSPATWSAILQTPPIKLPKANPS